VTQIDEQAHKLIRALTRLQDLHGALTLKQALIFLTIAAEDGIRQEELYRRLDLTDSSASRSVALFSDVGSRGFAGLDLIKVMPDADRRYRIIFLTNKGKRVAADLAAILQA
jgi:DNA-binding MarR family transcriptional regulator